MGANVTKASLALFHLFFLGVNVSFSLPCSSPPSLFRLLPCCNVSPGQVHLGLKEPTESCVLHKPARNHPKAFSSAFLKPTKTNIHTHTHTHTHTHHLSLFVSIPFPLTLCHTQNAHSLTHASKHKTHACKCAHKHTQMQKHTNKPFHHGPAKQFFIIQYKAGPH